MKEKGLCTFWGLLLLCSCSYRQIESEIDYAASIMNDSPQESLSILEKIDIESVHINELKARHAVYLSMALDKNYIDITSDSIISPAVDYYKHNSNVHMRMLSNYYQGIVFKNAGSYIPAILALDRAEEDAKVCGDNLYLGLVYRNKSEIETMVNSLHEAVEEMERAVIYFEKAQAHEYSLYARSSLATALINDRRYDRACTLLDSLLEDSAGAPLYHSNELAYCEALTEKREFREALNRYRQVDTNCFLACDWAYKALTLQKLGQKDSVLWHIDKAYEHSYNEADSATVQSIHSHIAATRKEFDTAYRLISHASHVQDSVTRQLLYHSVNIAQRDYFKKEYEIERQRKRDMTILSVVIAISAITVLILIVLIVKVKNQSEKQRIASLRRENMQLISSIFSEKIGGLDTMAGDIFSAKNAAEREAIFHFYKEKWNSMHIEDNMYHSLENALNKYYDNVIIKLKAQVPRMKENYLKLTILFFAGIPDITIQLISGKVSLNAVYTARYRCKFIINESNAPDTAFFIDLLDNHKRLSKN